MRSFDSVCLSVIFCIILESHVHVNYFESCELSFGDAVVVNFMFVIRCSGVSVQLELKKYDNGASANFQLCFIPWL